MQRFDLKPLAAKLAPRPLAEIAQMMIDWSTMPSGQFHETYPDFRVVLGQCSAKAVQDRDIQLTNPHRLHPNVVEADTSAIILRLFQHAMQAALAEPVEIATRVLLWPADPYLLPEDQARSMAVAYIDGEHGYTMEFAPSPSFHRELYDITEQNVIDALKIGRKGTPLSFLIENYDSVISDEA